MVSLLSLGRYVESRCTGGSGVLNCWGLGVVEQVPFNVDVEWKFPFLKPWF